MAHFPSSRALPVSSRLRAQRSPVDSRYMELKRAAARPTRFAGSRMRNTSKKTLNYSELTDDEDDEGDEEDEEDEEDEDDGTNSSSKGLTSKTYQQTHFSDYLEHSSNKSSGRTLDAPRSHQSNAAVVDLTGEDGEEASRPKLVVKLQIGKTANHNQRNFFQSQSTISYAVRKPMLNSQTSTSHGKYLLNQWQPRNPNSNNSFASQLTRIVASDADSGSGKLFKNLAIEILQHIASYLPKDEDIFSFRISCRSAYASITSSVWRKRFLSKYDLIFKLDTDDIAQKYEDRRRILIQRPVFDLSTYGHLLDKRMQIVVATLQQKFLTILKDLLIGEQDTPKCGIYLTIAESNNKSKIDAKGNAVVRGKNFLFILDMISDPHSQSYVDIVDAIFCTPWDQSINLRDNWTKIMPSTEKGGSIHVIQLCLAPYYLEPSIRYRQRHFDVSQFHVYSHAQPLFIGSDKQTINARLLLHIVNFFQFHLKAYEEGLLAHVYPSLQPDQLPHPWIGTIKEGLQPLSRHWKGIYSKPPQHGLYDELTRLAANLTPSTLKRLRSWDGEKQIYTSDHLDANDAFQDISFFFEESPERPWPKKWEDVLCSDTLQTLAATDDKLSEDSRPKIKEFWGTTRRGGTSGKNGHFFGRLHPLRPQQDIHGFQRVTLMKFDTFDTNGVDTYDGRNVWAYEGCALPGGTVIVGRWWNPRKQWDDKTSFGGPFLWWKVESPTTSMPIKPEEALTFQERFFDQVYGLH